MRAVAIASLLCLSACGGSIEWVAEEDENGFTIIPEVNVVPGGQAQLTMELLVAGSYVETYDITVTTTDVAQLTGSVNPTTATPEDGVPFPVTVTVTADPAATPGTESASVEATPSGESESLAGLSVRVVIN